MTTSTLFERAATGGAAAGLLATGTVGATGAANAGAAVMLAVMAAEAARNDRRFMGFIALRAALVLRALWVSSCTS